jgi:hypothetical protein
MAFYSSGTGSEWRGALLAAADLAKKVRARNEAKHELAMTIMAVCRFLSTSMMLRGSHQWVLAVGSQMLHNAVLKFEGMPLELPFDP